MLIAQRTKENNIAEHIVYMFQVEDLIRANNHDLDKITTTVIQPLVADEAMAQQYVDWYAGLIKKMKQERVQDKGHVSDINEILMELLLLHNTLLNISREKRYLEAFEVALPILKDFQHKSNGGDLNLIEVGFNALYGKMILKLKRTEISTASEEGFQAISQLLGMLAHFYKKMKQGDLNFTNN